MNKNRHIISELQAFFKDNDDSSAIYHISKIMNSLTIQSKVIGSVKNHNCKFTCLQVLQLLVLFPFFSVKNASQYAVAALGKMFSCHKAMFLCFTDGVSQSMIDFSLHGEEGKVPGKPQGLTKKQSSARLRQLSV